MSAPRPEGLFLASQHPIIRRISEVPGIPGFASVDDDRFLMESAFTLTHSLLQESDCQRWTTLSFRLTFPEANSYLSLTGVYCTDVHKASLVWK